MRIGRLLAAIAAVLVFATAAAAVSVTVVVDYDPALGELPEGVAVDKTGNVFVSVSPLGRIEKITPSGSRSIYAQVVPPGSGNGPLGLAVDAVGNVYAAVATFDPATSGVYRVARDGSSVRLAGTGAIAFPNGLTFDQRGNLYVTDTVGAAVWRIPRRGAAELWLQSPLLAGDGSIGFGFPLGANGIAYRQGELVVGNTELARLVRIPIEPDGSAGAPSILAQSPLLFAADGLAFDVHGNVWVAVIAQSAIRTVSPDGSIATVATAADGLDWASSIAFGTSHGERGSLYAVNFAIGPPGGPGPRLLKLDVGVRGQPVP